VYPKGGFAHDGPERRTRHAPPETLPAGERRQAQVRPAFAQGWLTFREQASSPRSAHTGQRRRLVPIPDGWEQLPDAELERCCRDAAIIPRAPGGGV
jgi:hypothetical protein